MEEVEQQPLDDRARVRARQVGAERRAHVLGQPEALHVLLQPALVRGRGVLGQEGHELAARACHREVARAPVPELLGRYLDHRRSGRARDLARAVARAGVDHQHLELLVELAGRTPRRAPPRGSARRRAPEWLRRPSSPQEAPGPARELHRSSSIRRAGRASQGRRSACSRRSSSFSSNQPSRSSSAAILASWAWRTVDQLALRLGQPGECEAPAPELLARLSRRSGLDALELGRIVSGHRRQSLDLTGRPAVQRLAREVALPAPMPRTPRVLVLHNRYRMEGGEERAVELQEAALTRAGVEHRLLERRSGRRGPRPRGRGAAARRGGRGAGGRRGARAPGGRGARAQPPAAPRPARARRGRAAAGARVVAQLHNFRLFCAIGVASRDGAPVLSLPPPAHAPGAGAQLPRLAARGGGLRGRAWPCTSPATVAAVDAFVVPSASTREQVVRLGLPRERVEVVPPLPARQRRSRTRAPPARGEYALVTARLSEEKGVDVAIRAAALTGVPLRVAGDGPRARRAWRGWPASCGAPVEFLGRADRAALAALLRRAAVVLVPSRFHETAGYAAMEAMAAGVPVLAERPRRPARDGGTGALRAHGRRRRAGRPAGGAVGAARRFATRRADC